MKRSRVLRRKKVICLAAFGIIALALHTTTAFTPAHAGTFSTDFNSGLPTGSSVFGTAIVDSAGGVNDSGVLKLTQAYAFGSLGSLIINDLDGGAPIVAFTASFKLLVGGAEPHADGLSFNFANDLPDDAFGEEGAGTGMTITLDSFDNGGGEAPAIDAKMGGVTVASTKSVGPAPEGTRTITLSMICPSRPRGPPIHL